jgi:hypothetical protein
MTVFVIRYESRATENGQPVGTVFAQRVADSIPGYPADIDAWSHTKTAAECLTRFATAEAAWAEIGRRRHGIWPEATVVEVDIDE